MRLIRIKEVVLFLDESSMIGNYINLIRNFIIIFKILVPLNKEVEVIEELAFIHFRFLLLL